MIAPLSQPALPARPLAGRCSLAISATFVLCWLSACASSTPPVAGPPFLAPGNPAPAYLERVNNGAIFRASMGAMFSGERKPSSIGDTLKVDISESVSAKRKLNTATTRENAVASKGPGGSASVGLFDKLLNLDASASGSDAFTGTGSTDNSGSFTGLIATSVINVLPNGLLVVAGERNITLNGGLSTLRFSGVVNPQDIKTGNLIASADVVNAHIELGGKGDLSDASSRNWLQRVLTKTLTVW